jgi:hypothetical protein
MTIGDLLILLSVAVAVPCVIVICFLAAQSWRSLRVEPQMQVSSTTEPPLSSRDAHTFLRLENLIGGCEIGHLLGNRGLLQEVENLLAAAERPGARNSPQNNAYIEQLLGKAENLRQGSTLLYDSELWGPAEASADMAFEVFRRVEALLEEDKDLNSLVDKARIKKVASELHDLEIRKQENTVKGS